MEIKVTIANASQWASAFKAAPDVAVREINRALEMTTTSIARAAVRNAPVNKQSGGGNLRQSIRSQVTGLRGIIDVRAKYALPVHEGTRPHIIRARNARVLANRRTGQFFGKTVRHPGTRAQPFLRKAVEDEKANTERAFNNALATVAKSIHP